MLRVVFTIILPLILPTVLFVVTVGFGTSTPGVYVPAHLDNGRIIRGHIEPSGRP
jgi:ABC-type uncharacterized transport system YnjBCD permease subunit